MTLATYVSVAIGYIAGLIAVLFVGRRIVAAILRSGPFEADRRTTVLRLAAAGGFVALVPALLLGIVVGGTLGSAYGGAVLAAIGAPASGVVLGSALGMFAVVSLVMCAAIAIGAYVGKLVARG